MEGLKRQIREQGWVPIEFPVSLYDRDEFAKVSHDLIALAAEDESVRKALTEPLDTPLNPLASSPGLNGIFRSPDQEDNTISLHGSYRTREKWAYNAPHLINNPKVGDYLEGLQVMLHGLKSAFRTSLESLSRCPENIKELFFPDDESKIMMCVQTVLRSNVGRFMPGERVGDVMIHPSLAVMDLHSDPQGFLHGARIEPGRIRQQDLSDRRDYFLTLSKEVKPITYALDYRKQDKNEPERGDQAAFSLGAGIAALNSMQALDGQWLFTGLDKNLPALLRSNIKPEEAMTQFEGELKAESKYCWLPEDTFVSVTGSLDPGREIPRDWLYYPLPGKRTCRPLASYEN